MVSTIVVGPCKAVQLTGSPLFAAAVRLSNASRLLCITWCSMKLNSTTMAPSAGGLYNPTRGTVQPGACDKAMGEYRGFWGWWME